jgi:hypothetical protein
MAGKNKEIELDKAELKKLLIRSKREPVNCAVGMAETGQALIQLHKIKQPRAVSTEMDKEYGPLKNLRWGKAEVDVDADPKLVVLILNKPAPGMARKLKKTLKGTGFTKVEIRNEDGSVAEAVGEEEEQESEGVETAARSAGEVPPAPPPPQSDAREGAAVDTTGFTLRLTGLIRRMAPLMSADAKRADELKAMAATARNAIANQQPDTAALLDQLEEALAQPSGAAFDAAGATRRLAELIKKLPAAIAASPAQGEALKGLAAQARDAIGKQDPQADELMDQLEKAMAGGGARPGVPASPELQAAPKLWRDTVVQLNGGVEQLKAAIRQGVADEPREVVAEIEKNLGKLDQIVGRFDAALADLLQSAVDAADEAARKQAIGKAKGVMAEHIKAAGGDAMIDLLDQNPFGVSPGIKKTLLANLGTLAKAVG